MSDDTNKKETQLELNQKTIKRAGDAFAAMKDEFTRRAPKRPAEELIRQYISEIDELSKLGASLTQIYERLNKAVPLGISPNSFSVYVRRVRKEIGSDQYNQRSTQKQNAEGKTEAAPAARAETNDAPAMREETASATGWNCTECKDGKPAEHRGKKYFECAKCGIAYAADADGNITTNRFSG